MLLYWQTWLHRLDYYLGQKPSSMRGPAGYYFYIRGESNRSFKNLFIANAMDFHNRQIAEGIKRLGFEGDFPADARASAFEGGNFVQKLTPKFEQ